jgi:hypothetical protein
VGRQLGHLDGDKVRTGLSHQPSPIGRRMSRMDKVGFQATRRGDPSDGRRWTETSYALTPPGSNAVAQSGGLCATRQREGPVTGPLGGTGSNE